MTEYNKAWTAVLTPLVTLLVTTVGLHLDAGAVTAITAALTGVAVFLVPNSYGTGLARDELREHAERAQRTRRRHSYGTGLLLTVVADVHLSGGELLVGLLIALVAAVLAWAVFHAIARAYEGAAAFVAFVLALAAVLLL